MSVSGRSPFLVAPSYDAVFFVLAPLWALALAALAFAVAGPGAPVDTYLGGTSALALALRSVIHAHLVIVFARSHLNRAVFARTPVRFVVVPLVLLAAMLMSRTLMLVLFGVVVVWDAYHSSMQTFGLARLYEVKAGGAPTEGRRVDLWACHAIYLGPLLCGPLLETLVHAVARPLGDVLPWFPDVATRALAGFAPWRAALAVACVLVVGAYAVSALRSARAGAPIAWVKHALFVSTAIACVLAWGGDPLGQGLFIVNVFHAAQYFGLVAWTERTQLAQRFGLRGRGVGAQVFALLAGVGLLYGFWVGAAPGLWATSGTAQTVALAVANTVALLHFWYDGFIWSVRRGDVSADASAAASG